MNFRTTGSAQIHRTAAASPTGDRHRMVPFMKSALPLGFLALALAAGPAAAHISVSSGPVAANATSEITFGVGHGCGVDDTISVNVEIPTGITSVRALRSDFGKPVIEKDDLGVVTSVTWTKADSELQDEDVGYYQLKIRARTPDQPFTIKYFKIHQTCRDENGVETVVHWSALPGEEGEDAAALLIIPKKYTGWNQFTLPAAMPELVAADFPKWFGDAQIVWEGTAAYSPNPATVTLIGATPGVTALTTLSGGDTVWVKY
jgi:periplasmic copper chaperone A